MRIHQVPVQSLLVVMVLLVTGLRVPASEFTAVLGDEIAAGECHPENQYQCDVRAAPDGRTWAVTAKSKTKETETVVLLSADAGVTWRARVVPQSSDPDCIFAEDGSLHVSVISKRDKDRVGYLRSPDGGLTWDERRTVPCAVDHPHLAVDRGAASERRGAIYLAGRLFSNKGVAVATSLDGGDTWTVTKHDLGAQLNKGFVQNVAVADDGTLLIGIRGKNNILSKNGSYAGNSVHLAVLRSDDGGASLQVVKLGTLDQGANSGPGGMFPVSLALHRLGAGERAYYLTSNKRPAPQPAGLWLRHSDDLGQTWSEPRALHPSLPEGLGVGQADLVTNDQGLVCIRYYATISEVSGEKDPQYPPYYVYAMASADGGMTFSEPVQLNTQALPFSPWGYQRRVLGGDQNFSCALPDGSFLFAWTDTRSKHPNYQIYLRRVRFE
ncbi:MAG: sialidase family protein [Planctomycetota bacterium]|jgi:hypothetical protein|nr:sialidase family protein [Planctomycetota bacterium]